MKAFRTLLSLALTLAIAGGAMAEDEKKPGEKKGEARKPAAAKKGDAKKGKGRKAPAVSALVLRGIELTEEQQKAVAPFDAEFGPKFAELQKAQQSILTEDQLKTQKEAFAKIREAGKDATPEQRKAAAEQRKAAASSVKLTDEQKARQAELRKAQGELRTAYLAKVDSILTADQKTKLKDSGKRPAKGDKKPGAKKPDARKPVKKDAA